jgi:inorganic phosphate transporter, PiT family
MGCFHEYGCNNGRSSKPKLDQGMDACTVMLFMVILAAGLFFTAYSIYQDVHDSGTRTTTYAPFLLLGVALLFALGFEFVNGCGSAAFLC